MKQLGGPHELLPKENHELEHAQNLLALLVLSRDDLPCVGNEPRDSLEGKTIGDGLLGGHSLIPC